MRDRQTDRQTDRETVSERERQRQRKKVIIDWSLLLTICRVSFHH